jgi:beta-lactamase regulating signal transducer with metallopeptidase domain
MDSILAVQSEFSIALATALFNAVWQCAALGGAAYIALQALSRSSAALRHAVGMGFLIAMAIWPIWSFAQVLWRPADATDGFAATAWTGPLMTVAPGLFTAPSSGWPVAVVTLWLTGVVWMLLRHIGGLWWVAKLESRTFHALPPAMQQRANALKQQMGITRDVVVRVVEDAVMPFTARLVRPVIWIPSELIARMPQARIEALLAHELAHIHRLDWLWNGVQCVIESLLFFHPGVWWLSGRIRQEREHACDDLAVSACTDPVVLAEALTDLARAPRPVSRLLLAANGGPLMERITRILPGAPAPSQSVAPVALACLLAAGVVYATQIGAATSGASTARTDHAFAVGQAQSHAELAARDRARAEADAQLAKQDAEQAERDVAQGQRDAELAALDRAQAERDAEHARRDAEQAQRDAAQARRDAEHAQRDAWYAQRDAEQARRDRENAAAAQYAAVGTYAPQTPLQPQTGPGSRVNPATQAIVDLVAADPSVTRQLGTPVAVSPNVFTGSWGFPQDGDLYGDVRISFVLAGPKGQASINVSALARRDDKQWRLTKLRISRFKPSS